MHAEGQHYFHILWWCVMNQ